MTTVLLSGGPADGQTPDVTPLVDGSLPSTTSVTGPVTTLARRTGDPPSAKPPTVTLTWVYQLTGDASTPPLYTYVGTVPQ